MSAHDLKFEITSQSSDNYDVVLKGKLVFEGELDDQLVHELIEKQIRQLIQSMTLMSALQMVQDNSYTAVSSALATALVSHGGQLNEFAIFTVESLRNDQPVDYDIDPSLEGKQKKGLLGKVSNMFKR